MLQNAESHPDSEDDCTLASNNFSLSRLVGVECAREGKSQIMEEGEENGGTKGPEAIFSPPR